MMFGPYRPALECTNVPEGIVGYYTHMCSMIMDKTTSNKSKNGGQSDFHWLRFLPIDSQSVSLSSFTKFKAKAP